MPELTQDPKHLNPDLPGAMAVSRHDRGRLSPALARIGLLEARLAQGTEIAAAQNVRYRVFFEEMGASPSPIQLLTQIDRDPWDSICDHLVILDHALQTHMHDKTVATCRLLSSQRSRLARREFYSQSEFNLAPMLAGHKTKRFMELGRSCVLAPWRNKRTVELLWAAIWRHARAQNIDVLFGCASFHATDPSRIAEQLSFLHHFGAASPAWQVRAREGRGTRMDWMAREEVDTRRALRSLPPLIKGYLRLGAMFGSEAVIDPRFGTIDVLVVLPVERIQARYVEFYGANGERHANS